MINKFLLILIPFLIFTISLKAQVTDKDGNNYTTVKIGKQQWMVENLDVSHFRNGDSIPEVENGADWQKAGDAGKPAWCYYKGDPANGKTYHKLYNWYAVNDSRGLAPTGWHIPSTSEWADITDYLGGGAIGGRHLKEASTSHWASPNSGADNSSGFTALPGGSRGFNGTFVNIGDNGYWWSSSEYDNSNAWNSFLLYSHNFVYWNYYYKLYGFSVRCVKD